MAFDGELTAKQAAFAREYTIDFNATAAAIRAGYSPNTAPEMGHENLKKPHIRDFIKQSQVDSSKAFVVSRDRVAAELAYMGFANLQDFLATSTDGNIDLAKLTRQQWAAVQEVIIDTVRDPRSRDPKVKMQRVRVKLHDKRGALIDLSKMMGWLTDKGESPALAGSDDYAKVRQAALLELSDLAKPIEVIDQDRGEQLARPPEPRKDR